MTEAAAHGEGLAGSSPVTSKTSVRPRFRARIAPTRSWGSGKLSHRLEEGVRAAG
jgi:hypothetical protein